jgi:hypothetical protein
MAGSLNSYVTSAPVSPPCRGAAFERCPGPPRPRVDWDPLWPAGLPQLFREQDVGTCTISIRAWSMQQLEQHRRPDIHMLPGPLSSSSESMIRRRTLLPFRGVSVSSSSEAPAPPTPAPAAQAPALPFPRTLPRPPLPAVSSSSSFLKPMPRAVRRLCFADLAGASLSSDDPGFRFATLTFFLIMGEPPSSALLAASCRAAAGARLRVAACFFSALLDGLRLSGLLSSLVVSEAALLVLSISVMQKRPHNQ